MRTREELIEDVTSLALMLHLPPGRRSSRLPAPESYAKRFGVQIQTGYQGQEKVFYGGDAKFILLSDKPIGDASSSASAQIYLLVEDGYRLEKAELVVLTMLKGGSVTSLKSCKINGVPNAWLRDILEESPLLIAEALNQHNDETVTFGRALEQALVRRS